MKILIVSLYYSPELGAAPSRITNMAEGLQAMGNQVDVLTSLPNYPKGRVFEGYRGCIARTEVLNGVRVCRLWSFATIASQPFLRALNILSFAIMLWLFVFRAKRILSYQRVIIQTPPLPVAASAITLFKKIFRRKVVVNVSDLWPLSAIELGAMKEGSVICRIFHLLERYIYRSADAILGQSSEILQHISHFPSPSLKIVYRNLQCYDISAHPHHRSSPFRIVYAGLLGVAQDILSIIENVDFRRLSAEFHLYGGGNQAQAIISYIADHPASGVVYHGYISKDQIAHELQAYDASIVPLTVRIRGAVPSKIYDLLPMGIPILFCGGGEGADIVEQNGFGLTSHPGDFAQLSANIMQMISMPTEQYSAISERCLQAVQPTGQFNFHNQIRQVQEFLQAL